MANMNHYTVSSDLWQYPGRWLGQGNNFSDFRGWVTGPGPELGGGC